MGLMDNKEFRKLYPRKYDEAFKDKIRRQLHIDVDEVSQAEYDWAVKKARARWKRRNEK